MEKTLKSTAGWIFAAMAGVCLVGGVAVLGQAQMNKKTIRTQEG